MIEQMRQAFATAEKSNEINDLVYEMCENEDAISVVFVVPFKKVVMGGPILRGSAITKLKKIAENTGINIHTVTGGTVELSKGLRQSLYVSDTGLTDSKTVHMVVYPCGTQVPGPHAIFTRVNGEESSCALLPSEVASHLGFKSIAWVELAETD